MISTGELVNLIDNKRIKCENLGMTRFVLAFFTSTVYSGTVDLRYKNFRYSILTDIT